MIHLPANAACRLLAKFYHREIRRKSQQNYYRISFGYLVHITMSLFEIVFPLQFL